MSKKEYWTINSKHTLMPGSNECPAVGPPFMRIIKSLNLFESGADLSTCS